MFANDDEDDVENKNGFLNIAKGTGDASVLQEEKPLTADQVKFKAESEEQEKVNGAP